MIEAGFALAQRPGSWMGPVLAMEDFLRLAQL
jgi:hypothetical protein